MEEWPQPHPNVLDFIDVLILDQALRCGSALHQCFFTAQNVGRNCVRVMGIHDVWLPWRSNAAWHWNLMIPQWIAEKRLHLQNTLARLRLHHSVRDCTHPSFSKHKTNTSASRRKMEVDDASTRTGGTEFRANHSCSSPRMFKVQPSFTVFSTANYSTKLSNCWKHIWNYPDPQTWWIPSFSYILAYLSHLICQDETSTGKPSWWPVSSWLDTGSYHRSRALITGSIQDVYEFDEFLSGCNRILLVKTWYAKAALKQL